MCHPLIIDIYSGLRAQSGLIDSSEGKLLVARALLGYKIVVVVCYAIALMFGMVPCKGVARILESYG